MFLTVSKRLKGGLSLGAGMRLTKRNFLWLIWVLMFYFIAYYVFWLSAWLLIGIVWLFFVLPIKAVYKLIKGRNNHEPHEGRFSQ